MAQLKHDHVVPLLDVFFHKQNLHLVYPIMVTDLAVVIRDTQSIMLTNAHIKKFMLMLLEGVQYLHENFIIHRDLAPSNMLIGADGTYHRRYIRGLVTDNECRQPSVGRFRTCQEVWIS